MPWVVTKLVLASFLLPAGLVFVLAYRHALRHWLRPAAPIPTASIASTRHTVATGAARRFHAVAIATAFASVSIMGLSALAIVVVAILGTVT